MATYNGVDYLSEQIESLIKQSHSVNRSFAFSMTVFLIKYSPYSMVSLAQRLLDVCRFLPSSAKGLLKSP